MKPHHTNVCPICRQALKKEDSNPFYAASAASAPRDSGIFICCAPLANDPLHYYTHAVKVGEPELIITQEFTVNLGSKYVLFRNNYELGESHVKSNKDVGSLQIPVLLVPDFPNLESLKSKIRLSITFS